jgi:DNA replication protein DnaC
MMQTADYLKQIQMPAARRCYEQLAEQARKGSWSYEQYLTEVIRQECESRMQNRIARNLRESKLLTSKTLENFDTKRLPAKVAALLIPFCLDDITKKHRKPSSLLGL